MSKRILPDRDYTTWPREPLTNFHRNLYVAPLSLCPGEDDGVTAHVGRTACP